MKALYQIARDDIRASLCGCGGCCRQCSAHQDDLLQVQEMGLVRELVELVELVDSLDRAIQSKAELPEK